MSALLNDNEIMLKLDHQTREDDWVFFAAEMADGLSTYRNIARNIALVRQSQFERMGRPEVVIMMPFEESEWPVHQPRADDAPIPGRHWYAGCNPDRPPVNPMTGICTDCGETACRECGRQDCPDHKEGT